jgi:hypothetical protein
MTIKVKDENDLTVIPLRANLLMQLSRPHMTQEI